MSSVPPAMRGLPSRSKELVKAELVRYELLPALMQVELDCKRKFAHPLVSTNSGALVMSPSPLVGWGIVQQ